MRQVWISKAGKPETLELHEAADPALHMGEVRIRVEACGVNFADILGRMGIYPDAPKIPFVPGYEVAGVIDRLGQGVIGLEEGDKVFAATRFGGYSDLVCVPHRQVFKRQDWVTAEDGAALPVNYLTAYMMLVVMGSLRPGDKVLIHGAAGGVGLASLDLCKILGAETFGTASPQKHDFLLERGLDHPIDYIHRDYEQDVRDLTAGQGVQLILDPLGGAHWTKNYRLLTPSGRLVYFGFQSAVAGKRRSLIDLGKLLFHVPFYTPLKLMNDNKGILGVNLARLWDHVDMMRSWMQQIMGWYDEALFRPFIDKKFRLEEATKAHRYIQDRKNTGKVLLIP